MCRSKFLWDVAQGGPRKRPAHKCVPPLALYSITDLNREKPWKSGLFQLPLQPETSFQCIYSPLLGCTLARLALLGQPSRKRTQRERTLGFLRNIKGRLFLGNPCLLYHSS